MKKVVYHHFLCINFRSRRRSVSCFYPPFSSAFCDAQEKDRRIGPTVVLLGGFIFVKRFFFSFFLSRLFQESFFFCFRAPQQQQRGHVWLSRAVPHNACPEMTTSETEKDDDATNLVIPDHLLHLADAKNSTNV